MTMLYRSAGKSLRPRLKRRTVKLLGVSAAIIGGIATIVLLRDISFLGGSVTYLVSASFCFMSIATSLFGLRSGKQSLRSIMIISFLSLAAALLLLSVYWRETKT